MLQFEKLVVGELQTNCFIVWPDDTKEALIIDPGDDGVGIGDFLTAKRLKPTAIVATHGHFDHVLGALDLKLVFNIPFYCSSRDQFLLNRQKETAKFFLKREIWVPNFKKIDIDLDKIEMINNFKIIKLPGHTPGSIGLYDQENRWLFSGDVLFEDGVGRTETKYGSKIELTESIRKIKTLDKITIFPGHGNIFEL